LAPCTRLTGVRGVAVSFGCPVGAGAAPAPAGAASAASTSATAATTVNLARRRGVPPRRADPSVDPGAPIATSGVGQHPRRRGTGLWPASASARHAPPPEDMPYTDHVGPGHAQPAVILASEVAADNGEARHNVTNRSFLPSRLPQGFRIETQLLRLRSPCVRTPNFAPHGPERPDGNAGRQRSCSTSGRWQWALAWLVGLEAGPKRLRPGAEVALAPGSPQRRSTARIKRSTRLDWRLLSG
jgi:hypothetical protein